MKKESGRKEADMIMNHRGTEGSEGGEGELSREGRERGEGRKRFGLRRTELKFRVRRSRFRVRAEWRDDEFCHRGGRELGHRGHGVSTNY